MAGWVSVEIRISPQKSLSEILLKRWRNWYPNNPWGFFLSWSNVNQINEKTRKIAVKAVSFLVTDYCPVETADIKCAWTPRIEQDTFRSFTRVRMGSDVKKTCDARFFERCLKREVLLFHSTIFCRARYRKCLNWKIRKVKNWTATKKFSKLLLCCECFWTLQWTSVSSVLLFRLHKHDVCL